MRNGGAAHEAVTPSRIVRCAIYTRKSTEEGLSQEFNSLDAQREAGEAYIASQRHEGWTLIPDAYDDGGFTGANMERPALQRLLADIAADATRIEAVQTVLAGGLADMVFTDPPYNVDYEGKTARKLKIASDTMGGQFYEFLRQSCANMLAITKGAIYICMSSELHTLYRAFTDAGGHWSTFVIWAKHHFTLGRSDYQRMYEPVLYGWREGTDHYWCGDRNQGDVWLIKRPMANLEHPTMKPVELVERAIRNSSKTRDTILDVFGGSGTTLIACEKSGRQARLIELEPR